MMLRAGLVLSLLVATIGYARPAHADTDDPTLRQFASGALQRARRAVAIGPMVGVGVAYAYEPGETEVPVSFGLGLALFKIDVIPTPQMIKDMIIARTKAKVADRVRAMVTAGAAPPDEQEMARLGVEILAEVKAEILGMHRVRGKKLEKPRLTVAVEGTYLPRAGSGQARLTLGIGIKSFTIGPTLVGDFAGANGLYVGGELALHFTPRQGTRSPVIDTYLRYDFGATGGTRDADQVGLGVRFLLDVL